MIPVNLLGTGSALPGRKRTTEAVVAEAWPGRDPVEVKKRIGIETRYWADPKESDASLAAQALERALTAAGCAASALRRLILTTSTGGDHLAPATANDVAGALGIDDTCDAFDVNNACTGFLTALDLGARSVATGVGLTAVVAVETFSRYLTPDNPRPYVVLGDAAAAIILGESHGEGGVLATFLRNSAHLRGAMNSPHPGRTGSAGRIEFGASSDDLTVGAVRSMRAAVAEVLRSSRLSMAEIEWFLPHQPNGLILRELVNSLEISEDKIIPVLPDVGSVGSASIPLSLDRLVRKQVVRPGDRLLLCAVGAGTSYGATLYQVGR
jgi:3-oxoacyl-(acyl-carrier-protein) synthase III